MVIMGLEVTVAKLGFLWSLGEMQHRPCLVLKKICKIFQIFRHIESLDVCMKY